MDFFTSDSDNELLFNNEFLDSIYYYYVYIGSIVVSAFYVKLYLSRANNINNARTWVPL
jgi:hypothetical protein